MVTSGRKKVPTPLDKSSAHLSPSLLSLSILFRSRALREKWALESAELGQDPTVPQSHIDPPAPAASVEYGLAGMLACMVVLAAAGSMTC